MTKNSNTLTIFLLALFLIVTCFSGSSSAELYLWTDPEGTKHFTTYKPPKEASNISVTSTSNDNENYHYKQKTQTPEKIISSTTTAAKTNKPLTKAEEDKIDKEIQALWKKHWKDLNNGDVDAALQSYSPSSRKTYRPILEKLYGSKRK